MSTSSSPRTFELVKLTKLGAVGDPLIPTPEWDGWDKDGPNIGFPSGFEVTGTLDGPLCPGSTVEIQCLTSNGIQVDETFRTSLVTELNQIDDKTLTISTMNSVYLMRTMERRVTDNPTIWMLN